MNLRRMVGLSGNVNLRSIPIAGSIVYVELFQQGIAVFKNLISADHHLLQLPLVDLLVAPVKSISHIAQHLRCFFVVVELALSSDSD